MEEKDILYPPPPLPTDEQKRRQLRSIQNPPYFTSKQDFVLRGQHASLVQLQEHCKQKEIVYDDSLYARIGAGICVYAFKVLNQ